MYVLGTILTGFIGAVLSGMFGIGGAVQTTVALRLILRASPELALGTTLPAVIPTAIAGAFTYYRRGLVDTEVVLWCSLGGITGSTLGAWLTGFLDIHYLMILTGVIVLYIAFTTIRKGIALRRGVTALSDASVSAEMVADADNEGCRNGPVLPNIGRIERILILMVMGFASGFYSGLLGLGGGLVLVPAMLYILKMPIKKTFGTSLAVIPVIAIPGTIVHALIGHVSGWLFLYLVAGVVPGAYIGARISIRSKESFLFICLGVLIAVFGTAFILNEIISMMG